MSTDLSLVVGTTVLVAAAGGLTLASAGAQEPPTDLPARRAGEATPLSASTATAAATEPTTPAAPEHPTAIEIKGVRLTPGGFVEATGIFRSRNENADVGSTWGSLPLDGSANAHLTEFRGSARHSRLTLLVESLIGPFSASGYYEMDFLGAAPTANEIESNAFNPRVRQVWVQLATSGFVLAAGQTWSLMTMDRKGTAPKNELVPLTIDSQYVVGFNWTRQWGLRAAVKLEPLWVALAVENPETTLGVVNPPAGVLGFNTSPNASSPGSQFTLNNTAGANGISTDLAPDLTIKVVLEPGWGHFEVKGLGRLFRDRSSGRNHYAAGGGLGIGALMPLVPNALDLVVSALGGDGIGRYASAVGPDVTLRPDGTVVPIRALQLFGGLELHPVASIDAYVYAGAELYDRTAYVDPATGRGVGFGVPDANLSGCAVETPTADQPCQASNRTLWQITPGIWYRPYKGPEGTVQLGAQYSYTVRRLWRGAEGAEPKGHESIAMAALRYYVP